jgi:hypothetical protein
MPSCGTWWILSFYWCLVSHFMSWVWYE